MKFNARRVSLFDRFIFQPGKRAGKSSLASNASRSRRGAREHVENHEHVESISAGGVTLSPPMAIDPARLQPREGGWGGGAIISSITTFVHEYRAIVAIDPPIDQGIAQVRSPAPDISTDYAGSAARHFVQERGKCARVTRAEHSQLRYVTLAACEHCRRVMPTCRGGGTCVIHLAVSRHGH